MNRVNLLGRIGNDPEVRYMPNGNAVANFSMATTKRWTVKDTNEKKEKTEWHTVKAFGKMGEIIAQHVKKGDQLVIEGSLEYKEWEKDGVKRYATDIVASEFHFVGSKREPGNQKVSENNDPKGGGSFDSDIPFMRLDGRLY